jgi:hypothetical protein
MPAAQCCLTGSPTPAGPLLSTGRPAPSGTKAGTTAAERHSTRTTPPGWICPPGRPVPPAPLLAPPRVRRRPPAPARFSVRNLAARVPPGVRSARARPVRDRLRERVLRGVQAGPPVRARSSVRSPPRAGGLLPVRKRTVVSTRTARSAWSDLPVSTGRVIRTAPPTSVWPGAVRQPADRAGPAIRVLPARRRRGPWQFPAPRVRRGRDPAPEPPDPAPRVPDRRAQEPPASVLRASALRVPDPRAPGPQAGRRRAPEARRPGVRRPEVRRPEVGQPVPRRPAPSGGADRRTPGRTGVPR